MVTLNDPSVQPLISHIVANPASGCGKRAQWIKVAPRKSCCPLVASPDYHIKEGLVPDSYCPVGSIARLSNTYA